jgi:hypothetical protein
MDYREHESTYAGFVRFTVIGTLWCLTIVVGLAIGGPGHSWGMAGFLIFLSTRLCTSHQVHLKYNH